MLFISLVLALAVIPFSSAWLNDVEIQKYISRIYQTALRGPRFPGSTQQNSMLQSIAMTMETLGAEVQTLNYTMYAWDPRYWYIVAHLKNDTDVFVPTVGYYPYSGDTGLSGRTGTPWDAGTFAVDPTSGDAVFDSLNLDGVSKGQIVFFDSPMQTGNESAPTQILGGTGRNIPASDIPELGNQTNPHVTSKVLNFTTLEAKGVAACISSWVDVSDENAALQWRPASNLSGNKTQNVPTLFVGNSTGVMLRNLISSGAVDTITVMLDAPSSPQPSFTLLAKLPGLTKSNDSLMLYTHSDGPTIIEENGPIDILTIMEYFKRNPINLNIQAVIETGHLASGHLNESAWMGQRPDILQDAQTAFLIEHLGAIQWKDVWQNGVPVYSYTGKDEPVFTYANGSDHSTFLRNAYLSSFDGTPDRFRMPLIIPEVVNNKVVGHWKGLGGASTIGLSNVPAIGVEVQPDYLWASFVDNGWSKFDAGLAISEIEVLLQTAYKVDQAYLNGTRWK